MMRWIVLGVAAMLLIACSTANKPLEDMLPSSVSGWTRTAAEPLDPGSAPELISQLGLKRALSATYTGPATVRVRVFEMNVSTSAFELIQKWKQQDGLAVYNGPYFVAADPGSAPQASSLLEALRRQLQ